MKKVVILSIFFFIFFGCTPSYMQKNILITKIDLKILEKTDEILTKEIWQKKDVIFCKDSEKLTLFCALEKASIEILNKYNHRQAALQEVRFVIDDNFKDRVEDHRLKDFNSHSKTSFEDVKYVIHKAIKIIKVKLAKTSNK